MGNFKTVKKKEIISKNILLGDHSSRIFCISEYLVSRGRIFFFGLSFQRYCIAISFERYNVFLQRKGQGCLQLWKTETVFPSGTMSDNHIVQYERLDSMGSQIFSFHTTCCVARCNLPFFPLAFWSCLNLFRLLLQNTTDQVAYQ